MEEKLLNVSDSCHEHVRTLVSIVLAFCLVFSPLDDRVSNQSYLCFPHSGLKKVGMCGVARRRKHPDSILDLL